MSELSELYTTLSSKLPEDVVVLSNGKFDALPKEEIEAQNARSFFAGLFKKVGVAPSNPSDSRKELMMRLSQVHPRLAALLPPNKKMFTVSEVRSVIKAFQVENNLLLLKNIISRSDAAGKEVATLLQLAGINLDKNHPSCQGFINTYPEFSQGILTKANVAVMFIGFIKATRKEEIYEELHRKIEAQNPQKPPKPQPINELLKRTSLIIGNKDFFAEAVNQQDTDQRVKEICERWQTSEKTNGFILGYLNNALDRFSAAVNQEGQNCIIVNKSGNQLEITVDRMFKDPSKGKGVGIKMQITLDPLSSNITSAYSLK